MWTWLYRLVNFIMRIVCFIVYPRRVSGRKNMPETGPVVVVCNHIRFHDVFNVATCFRRRLVFMAKKELYKSKFVEFWFRRYGSFDVDRDSTDMGAMRTAISLLKNGGALVMFPEGTRRRGEKTELGEIKKGAVLIAQKAGAMILPMYISTNERAFQPMYVKIGKAFSLDETKRPDTAYFERMAARIRQSMLDLKVDV